MTNPIASFSGLASGVQWRDIVDQLLAVERSRSVEPIQQLLTQGQDQHAAWTTFNGLVEKLNDAARALRAGGIGGFTASPSISPTTSRTLFNTAVGAGASAGSYKVEVLQLAQTAKIGGDTFANTGDALGIDGDLTIDGRTITIDSGDSLVVIRDKINAANSGLGSAGIAATIVSEGGTAGRLVLTRNSSGAQQIEISESASGAARELGLLDTKSRFISSTVTAIATALGLQTFPPPAAIRVNGRLITVDLENESLAAVVAKINAAGAQASVVEEPYGDETRFRLRIQGNVQPVQGDNDSAAVINALGLTAGGFSGIGQTISSGSFTDGSDAIAQANTSLIGIKVDGVPAGLSVGDAVNIRGTRGDGTAVTFGFVVQPGDTMQTLLDRINDATSGFGAGARTATAVLGSDGAIRLTDDTAGDSRLTFSLSVSRADGTVSPLGTTSTTTVGRNRQLSAGQDSMVMVDGMLVTRSSNNIAEVIPGISLSLVTAEPGSQVDLTVSQDTKAGVEAVRTFADAYNAIVKFFDEQRAGGKPLSGSPTLRDIVNGLTDGLRTEVAGNATYSRLTLMGLSLDRQGLLSVDESKVRAALSEKPEEVEALFGFDGVGNALVNATDNATRFGTGSISVQLRSIDERKVRLESRKSDAERRIEEHQAALIQQYVRMESALSMLNSQGGFLAQQISALQNKR